MDSDLSICCVRNEASKLVRNNIKGLTPVHVAPQIGVRKITLRVLFPWWWTFTSC